MLGVQYYSNNYEGIIFQVRIGPKISGPYWYKFWKIRTNMIQNQNWNLLVFVAGVAKYWLPKPWYSRVKETQQLEARKATDNGQLIKHLKAIQVYKYNNYMNLWTTWRKGTQVTYREKSRWVIFTINICDR